MWLSQSAAPAQVSLLGASVGAVFAAPLAAGVLCLTASRS